MKKILLFLAVLIPSLSRAASITSAQAGNWGSASTWVGGVIPGNGDTVNLFHIVTDTDTRIVGTSPSSGTVVVTLNSTGTIHITSTGYLKIRGDVIYTADSSTQDAVDIDGGGIWEFDSSLASAPTFQKYAFYPNNNFGYRTFVASGTVSAHAVLKANASSGMGALRMNGEAYGGGYTFYYADLANMSFESFFKNDSEVLPHWDVTYSSFTGCGVITDPGGLSSGGTFRHEHNVHAGTVGSITFNFQISSFKNAGTRSIQSNVFDSQLSTNGGFSDFIIANNYLGDAFMAPFSSCTFSGNFAHLTNDQVSISGSITTSYFLLDQDHSNPHVINGFGSYQQYFSGLIFGQSGRNTGDSGEFLIFDPATTSTRTVNNSIFLPNGNGYGPVEITSILGNAQYHDDFEHNTYFGGASLGASFAPIDYSETGNNPPGAISVFKNNLLWNPELAATQAGFSKVFDVGNQTSDQNTGYGVGPTTDVCSPSNCDYNASYGTLVSTLTAPNSAHYHNQGKGYLGNFSSTPGTHDLDNINPNFLNYHRYAEAFDGAYYRPYLGLSAAAAWSSGSSYSIGNIVSHSTGTLYWGDSVNYRYTNGSGCSSGNPEPGAGTLSTWESCWEFATYKDIKDSITSGLVFTDSSIGAVNSTAIQTLILWIRAGYAPSNIALHNAASDGTDIGAVPFQSTRGPSDPFPSGFKLFPSTNVWQTDISKAVVSSSSTIWIDVINGHAGHNFHANFGSAAQGDGSYNGIPYNLVWSSATPRMTVPIGTYATESDTPPAGGIPIPSDAIAENDIVGTTKTVTGDQHLLIVDVSSGMIYEMFVASRVVNSSSWTAAQLTIWYSTSNVLRTDGWTSADAAGLPVTQGLLRYDEVSPSCNITHAIRMELSLTHGPFIWPGRHDADSGGVLNPPFGMRVRMKSNVDLSVLSSTTSICIFNAAKKYGFILADNGGDWFIDGVPNVAWDDTALHNDFITVGLPVNTMEVVDESTWIVDPNSGQAKSPFSSHGFSGPIKTHGAGAIR